MRAARTMNLASNILAAALLCAACVEASSFTAVAPSIPTLRLPMNNAYLAQRTETDLPLRFVWEASTAYSSEDIRYELQLSTDSMFEESVTLVKTKETSHQLSEPLPISSVPPVGARYFWRVRACIRDSCSAYSRHWYANIDRVIKDFNGDGYSDLAVGATGDDETSTNGGKVFLYLGGPGEQLNSAPDLIIGGYTEFSESRYAGSVLDSAGDLNGDGFADLVLGSPNVRAGNYGDVYIYFGGNPPNGDGIADSNLHSTVSGDGFGRRVGPLGDVNGDGRDDIFVVTEKLPSPTSSHVSIHFGQPTMDIKSTPEAVISYELSTQPAAAGDVNGDGFADLIVQAARYPNDEAQIYLGEDGNMFDTEIDETILAVAEYADGVSTAGDINGDGYSDLLIAHASDDLFSRPGTVDLYLGTREVIFSKPWKTLTASVPADWFGSHLEPAGDINSDGFDDILIGADHSINEEGQPPFGKVYVYLGAPGSTFSPVPIQTFPGKYGTDFPSMISAGDFNGDGLNDFALSSAAANQRGKVDIYLTKSGGRLDAEYDFSFQGTDVGDSFGEGMASLPPVRWFGVEFWAGKRARAVRTSSKENRLALWIYRSRL
jgi:FG-GAP-like repeat/FG-GAP repeat